MAYGTLAVTMFFGVLVAKEKPRLPSEPVVHSRGDDEVVPRVPWWQPIAMPFINT